MKRTTLVIALWAVFVVTMSAQKAGNEQQLAKEANEFFASGDFLKAYPLYSQLVSLYPQNADYSYRFGACAIYSDPDKSKAIKFLSSATKRNVADPMAWYYLGKAYHLNYQFKEAVKSYEEFVSKADPKISAKYNAQREIETCIYGSNLLSNIKDLVVINKVEADRNSFFRYMDLDGIGGKILTVPVELQTKLDQKSSTPGVIHYPGNSTTIYFSSYGADGSTGKDIYKAQILPDGKFTKAEKVKGDVNTKYDEDYCFLHSDGKTLYFASKGHNSMGGYDIFKCVMDPTTGVFGPAINLDFAINTPDDDIFYIADSLNQKAYFASGRSSDLNHLHVYNVMVQGIPLQIVYLKGLYSSEIDAEQKNATIQIRDVNTGRVVMENNTNGENGNYTLYVPKAGEYKFYVKTENSPVVHETEVTIPPFDKPVALRQEMKLVKENGQEKLVVTNYFNEILNEDISALAQEMLRRKAGLDVNDSPPMPNNNVKEELALSVEKTMENVALAAGFGNDVTVQSVIRDMQNDTEKAKAFIASADKKINTAYHHAREKEQRANELTAKAEMLNSTITGAMNDDDVQKLRDSQMLLREAQALKREAYSSILAAKAIQNEKLLVKADFESVSQNLEELQKNSSEQNFDGTLISLQKEKDRIIANRMAKDDGLATMNKEARLKEEELHKSEDKLNYLRQSEKEKIREIELLEQRKANSKKKSEQAELETAIVNAKADLDGIRRGILDRNKMTEKLGKETRDMYAAIEVYKQLSANENLEYASVNNTDESQRATLNMRIEALETRFEKLTINDPQTLALIGEIDNDVAVTPPSEKANANTTQPSNSRDAAVELTSPAISQSNGNQASSTVRIISKDDNGSSATSSAENNIPNNVQQIETQSINENFANTQAKINAIAPNNPAAQRMLIVNSSNQAENRIREIQKKRTQGITTEEKQELQNLIAFRDEIKEKIQPTQGLNYSSENLRAIATSVQPEYAGALIDIENQDKDELEKVKDRVAFQKTTIEKLQMSRAANAAMAATANSANEISEITQRDQELEAAIVSLQNEVTSINTFKAAFDLENKEIIKQSNQRVRLENQIELTQNYLNTLESIEADFREQLALSTDLKESENLRLQIGEIVKEKQLAEGRMNGYQSDLQLTANASEPNDTDSTLTATTLEEELEIAEEEREREREGEQEREQEGEGEQEQEREREREREGEREGEGEREQEQEEDAVVVREKIEEDAKEIKAIMKPRVETESLFAYESNEFNRLKNEHPETAAQLKEQDKIEALQSQIVLLEAEIEMEPSARKQKKMDRQAEKLYTKKAELELKNTEVIATLTQSEYYKLIGEVDQLNTDNQEDLNSRTTLRDEVQKLYNQSSNNIDEAKALREKAIAINDPLEKNDYYRQAFAKEALAINQLTQIKDIHENMDLLLNYDDQELAELRYGKVENVLAKKIGKEETSNDLASTPPTPTPPTPTPTPTPTPNPNPTPTPTPPPTPTPTPTPSSLISPSARADAGYYADADASNYYFSFPEYLERNLFVRTRSAVYTNATPIPMNPEMPKGVYYSVQIGAFRNPIPQNLYDEFAPIVGDKLNNGITRYIAGFFLTFENADDVKSEIRRMGYSDAFVVAYRDGKRIPLYEAMGKTENDVLSAVEKEYVYGDGGQAPARSASMNGNVAASNALNNAESAKASSATNTTANNAAAKANNKRTDYYAGVKNAAPATQVESVKGLFFTVQVGVYSKPVPSSNLKNISPVNSELTQNEKIRYTSGIYSNLEDAVNQRNAAKQLGIADAFITAYYNGERITLSEADRLLKELGPSILVK